MGNVRRIYVEKKEAFAVKARELEEELRGYLGINGLEKTRILIRYDVENISDDIFEKACRSVFSEPPVDDLYLENIEMPKNARCFSVEYLPGQFDQRADSAVQCVQFLKEDEQPLIKTAVTYLLTGTISDDEFDKIKNCEYDYVEEDWECIIEHYNGLTELENHIRYETWRKGFRKV